MADRPSARRTRRTCSTRSVATALVRQPAFLVITLIQPMIWLLLFGELFSPVVEIPGFDGGGGSYLEFLTPGVVVMTALFSGGWAGTVYIEDMNRGVMDRLLASPVRRGALMNGTLVYQSVDHGRADADRARRRAARGRAVRRRRSASS